MKQSNLVEKSVADGASPVALQVKNLPASAGDSGGLDLVPGWEDPLEEAWRPTPVFLTGKSVDRGVWWAAVRRVAKGQTRLKCPSVYTRMHARLIKGQLSVLSHAVAPLVSSSSFLLAFLSLFPLV